MSRNLDWMDDAACRDHPEPDIFFPTEVGMGSRRQVAEAARVCNGCPVGRQCHDHKVWTGATSGVWAGGVHRTKALGRDPSPIEHGTDHGYHRHLKAKQRACERCRFAHAAAERKRVAG